MLREALMRLSGEGLAKNQAQQGFRVMEISLEDLADLTAARCLIEGMVLRESIENGDLEWESRIVAAHHRLERTPQKEDPSSLGQSAAFVGAHYDFHMALCSAAKNKRLIAMVGSLRAASEVYTQWSVQVESPKRDAQQEHKRLLTLSLDRDVDGAVAALNAHLQVTARLVLDAAQSSKQ